VVALAVIGGGSVVGADSEGGAGFDRRDVDFLVDGREPLGGLQRLIVDHSRLVTASSSRWRCQGP